MNRALASSAFTGGRRLHSVLTANTNCSRDGRAVVAVVVAVSARACAIHSYGAESNGVPASDSQSSYNEKVRSDSGNSRRKSLRMHGAR